jgi:site-specific DNA recombinase
VRRQWELDFIAEQLFALYRQHQALLPVVRELQQRGWVNKQWLTRQGHRRGGQAFTRASLYRLLTCVTYTGQMCP